ncbi:MAG: hypothetical protein V2I41_17590, partial [Pseudomonadales bacterium]|nr:hypothetical protein [Pseudomonadales bacterium]
MQNQSDPSNEGIDALIDTAMRPLADGASNFIFFSIEMFGTPVPLIVLWLVAGGVFFTVYLRFINFRGFRHAIELVSGKHVEADDPGQISQ